MSRRILWGDLHNHCNVSYGWGSLERALAVARQQLDFVSVTGHASWPDMPTDEARYGEVIRYHTEGFERLRRNWPRYLDRLRTADEEGAFVTFPGFEWHSTAYGDHHVVLRDFAGEPVSGDDPAALAAALAGREALLVPHHTGYGPRARGIDWNAFDGARSPVVEMISSHGSSEADGSPRPVYHTMGPRVHAGTVAAGLEAGHRFGVVGSTDHHGGFPGHYGAGRAAVFAEAPTREAIWEALRERRCYAVTGDKIRLAFAIDGTGMGGVAAPSSERRVRLRVEGRDRLDRVEVLKNGRPLVGRLVPPDDPDVEADRWLLRLEWGWGEKGQAYAWEGAARVEGGEILEVEPTFRGNEMLDPRDDDAGMSENAVPHEVLESGPRRVRWRSTTYGNPHPSVPATSGLILEIAGGLGTHVALDVNGMTGRFSLRELRRGSRRLSTRSWLEPAVHVHRPVAPSERTFELELADAPASECDHYMLRVGQVNDQWAWSSPIWVPR
ncbi:MAG TPA: DUF3604 domain-containing protein [Trueperaceae bacterium]|nr:DUF3604 domain-containing protein [Trueperaceae bacterium]